MTRIGGLGRLWVALVRGARIVALGQHPAVALAPWPVVCDVEDRS